MKLNLNHNTVIRETVTDGFLRYFQESLVPQLLEKYGEGISEVQMYESHLEKDLSDGAEWYYPLSLCTDSGNLTQWVAWEYPKGGAFLEMNPYAYASGAPLAFRLVDEVPEQLLFAVGKDTPLAPTDALPISVGVVAGNVRMLIGKYSQSFLDSLARAITREIERTHNVDGLAESGIHLEMLFAPMTYMEHNCEGVTYRRLTISEDGARTAKDFWVRWQRASGNEPVTVSEPIREGEVLFFLGEDVPQKVREKEYRYLLRQNAEKYRSAMGRKTVTEWRELLKKALKRGALSRKAPSIPKEAPIVNTETVLEKEPIFATYETPSASPPQTLPAEADAPQADAQTVVLPTENEEPSAPDTAVQETDRSDVTETAAAADPWLARLKEFAGEEPSAPDEQPAVEENTEEFRDAMMRMRSILGISNAEDAADDTPDLTSDFVSDEPCDEASSPEQADGDAPSCEQPSMDSRFGEESPLDEPAAVCERDEPLTPENPVPKTEISFGDAEQAAPAPETNDPERSRAERGHSTAPLFTKPVQEDFFGGSLPEYTEPKPEKTETVRPVRTEQNEAELRRQIRDGVLREIEMRERERLAEEARRAVIEKEEREAEMARIAQERMEAEASRRELEELREKTRVLSEELRVYTQMCMDIMNATPVPEKAEAAEVALTESPAAVQENGEPWQEQITFTVSKSEGEKQTVAEQAPEEKDEITIDSASSEALTHADVDSDTPEADPTPEETAVEEGNPSSPENSPKRYSFTEEELSALLREHTERIEMSLREEARRIALEELEKERAAMRAEMANREAQVLQQTNAPTEQPEAEQSLDVCEQQGETVVSDAQNEGVIESAAAQMSDTAPETETQIPTPQAQIADLLLRSQREQEEEQRRLALEALIREQEEKLAQMRREEEERRLRAEQLIAEQARLEELARIERERAEEENRRLEEERKRAEQLALQSYEKHLIEAKRLEEELEAARRRREEEDLRIAEAERRIAEQTRLAEEAREQQRIKNEEARRLTEEAEQRLSEIDAARERGRELAERTEEESRLMQQSLQEQEERLRREALRREQEEQQRIAAERLVEQRLETPTEATIPETPKSYNYVSRVVHLYFSRAIDPNVIGQIHRLMSDTIAYFNKTHVSISVRAEIVGTMQLDLNFIRIPKEEEPLLINIVKVLGRSNIGVRRASIDD